MGRGGRFLVSERERESKRERERAKGENYYKHNELEHFLGIGVLDIGQELQFLILSIHFICYTSNP